MSLVLALNYFSFHCEFDDQEYAEQHRQLYNTPSIALPSINWESNDKTNAPEAFVVDPIEELSILLESPFSDHQSKYYFPPYFTIRDKSPPIHTSEM